MLSDPAGRILLGSFSDVASGPFGSIVAWGLALITMSDVGRGWGWLEECLSTLGVKRTADGIITPNNIMLPGVDIDHREDAASSSMR